MTNTEKNLENFKGILEDIFNSDQDDRFNGLMQGDFEKFLDREKERRVVADDIYRKYKKGSIKLDGLDLYHLAMIYQHGSDSNDYKIALELSKESAETGCIGGKWLSAAAEDRYLISIGKKQVWGTQFQKDGNGWKYHGELEEDSVSGITDEERELHFVPKRSEQLMDIERKHKIKN